MTWSLAIIKEALLQTAMYAGVPAANTGFNLASEELESIESDRNRSPLTASTRAAGDKHKQHQH